MGAGLYSVSCNICNRISSDEVNRAIKEIYL